MNNGKITRKVKVEDMSCSSCEDRILQLLQNMEGVSEADTSYASKTLTVTYDPQVVSFEKISQKLQEIGYPVSPIAELGVKNEQKSGYGALAAFAVILLGGYLVIQNTIGFNYLPRISNQMGYGVLFLIGILTSVHCLAMCGGINLSVCLGGSTQSADPSDKKTSIIRAASYHLGRVISYTVIGGVIGALGSVFQVSPAASAAITILASAFMVIMGLNMLDLFPWLRRLNPRLPKSVAVFIHGKKKDRGPFIVGLLNGFMPCGPLQAMQLYALGTGSFVAGALSMLLFSLGTVPLLFAFSAVSTLLSTKFTRSMRRISAVLVMFLGAVMLIRGLALAGVDLGSAAKQDQVAASVRSEASQVHTSGSAASPEQQSSTDGSASADNGVQQVETTLTQSGYTPITVTKGIPVKWTIKADSSSLTGCNNVIIIPKYGIRKELAEGDNVIEFTPSETGSFGYSCWMGMIRSSITVTDASAAPSDGSSQIEQVPKIDNTGLPQSCCGGGA